LKLKEADTKDVVYATKNDVKDVQSKVKPGTEIHVVDDNASSSKPVTNSLGMSEATDIPAQATDTSNQQEFGGLTQVAEKFFMLLDKNAPLVAIANNAKAPKDKLAIANEFIKRLQMDGNTLNKLKTMIADTLATSIGESTEVNPKMKKKDLLELIEKNTKLKVVETIKVKNLKK
jgi:hypothetical protein